MKGIVFIVAVVLSLVIFGLPLLGMLHGAARHFRGCRRGRGDAAGDVSDRGNGRRHRHQGSFSSMTDWRQNSADNVRR